MSDYDGPNVISGDGLRYKKRGGGGSPFGPTQSFPTTSCFKCGVHKPRSLGSFKAFIGQSVFVCHDCQAEVAARRAAAR